MVEPKYKRILIKLSGEALAGEKGVGINIATVQKMAEEIKEVHELGIQIALVIGGGNLWQMCIRDREDLSSTRTARGDMGSAGWFLRSRLISQRKYSKRNSGRNGISS